MKKLLVFLASVTTLFSCNLRALFDGPDTLSLNFEPYANVGALMASDSAYFNQIVEGNNTVEIENATVHAGSRSLRCTATATVDTRISKASFNRGQMAFWEGETVTVSAWYYLVGTQNKDWLFLFDIEEKTSIGAYPGTRLALVDGALAIEHKYPQPITYQTNKVPFPREAWVHVEFQLRLSKSNQGWMKLWQDGVLLIEKTGWKTLPSDVLYYTQGSKGMYTNVEFGITANTRNSDTVLYVDDIDVGI